MLSALACNCETVKQKSERARTRQRPFIYLCTETGSLISARLNNKQTIAADRYPSIVRVIKVVNFPRPQIGPQPGRVRSRAPPGAPVRRFLPACAPYYFTLTGKRDRHKFSPAPRPSRPQNTFVTRFFQLVIINACINKKSIRYYVCFNLSRVCLL